MADVRIQQEPFDLELETRALIEAAGPSLGGVASFIGLVRADPSPDGRVLCALTLEHYPGMTERALAATAAEAGRRFDLLACTLIHRIGRLPLGAPIVLVLAAAAHRRPALEATAFLIDALKTDAPFWKRQDYTDGSSAWVEARTDDEAASVRWR